MSDLAATNCQTSCNSDCGCGFGGNSIIWILFLLFFCNNGCSSWSREDGCNSCDSIIWILILLFFCGNNSGRMGLGCGCGC